MIYKSIDALAPIEKLVSEAGEALSDNSRIESDDGQLNEALGLAGGVGAGGAVGFAALYFGGTVGLSAAGISSGLAAAGALIGGGMAAGIGVIAAPAVVLGVGGYTLISRRNIKKLIHRKEMLMQEIMRKQNAVAEQLQAESARNNDRASYLTRLNTLLQQAIVDLRIDLDEAKSA
ncbi:MAG: hypothetical protein GC200_12170 [Tepidisphaera sp.]|nr:hypothetical protein [Tepidisphaera sp.]